MANTKINNNSSKLSGADRARLERIRRREIQSRRSKLGGVHTRSVKVPTKKITRAKQQGESLRQQFVRALKERKTEEEEEEEEDEDEHDSRMEHKYDSEEDEEKEEKNDIRQEIAEANNILHQEEKKEEEEERKFSPRDVRAAQEAALNPFQSQALLQQQRDEEETEDEEEEEEKKSPVRKAPRIEHIELRQRLEEEKKEREEESRKAPRKIKKAKAKKKNRSHPGVKALRDIRKYQRSSKLMFQKLPFQKFVRNTVAQVASSNMLFRRSALNAVQAQVEAWIVSVFEDDNLGAIHDHRVTVQEKDVAFVQRIRKSKTENQRAGFVPSIQTDIQERAKREIIKDWNDKHSVRGKINKVYDETGTPRTGMKNEALKRLARRAGIKRIQPNVFNEIRWQVNELIKVWARNCYAYTQLKRSKIVTLQDSIYALQATFGTLLLSDEEMLPMVLGKNQKKSKAKPKESEEGGEEKEEEEKKSPSPSEHYLRSAKQLSDFVTNSLLQHNVHTKIINLNTDELEIPQNYANQRAQHREIHQKMADYLWRNVLQHMNGLYPYVKSASNTLCHINNTETAPSAAQNTPFNATHTAQNNINSAIVGIIRQKYEFRQPGGKDQRWVSSNTRNAQNFIQKLRASNIVTIMKEGSEEDGKVVGFGFFNVSPADNWEISFNLPDAYSSQLPVMSIEALCAFGSLKGLAFYLIEKTMFEYQHDHNVDNLQFATVLVQDNMELMKLYNTLGFGRLPWSQNDHAIQGIYDSRVATFDHNSSQQQQRFLLNSQDFIGFPSLFTSLPVPRITT
jgi:histone H3